MKLNKRLLVTSGLLFAVSTIAMSTATYAWFTTNRTAQLNIGTTSIRPDSNLEYKLVTKDGSSQGATDYSTTAISVDGHQIKDVSGDGLNFYRPIIMSDDTTFASIAAVNTNKAYAHSYMLEFQIQFRSDKPYEVYLTPGDTFIRAVDPSTALTGTDTNQLCAATRLAIFDTGVSASGVTGLTSQKLSGVLVQEADADGYLFLNGTSAANTTKGTAENPASGYGCFVSDKVVIAGDISTYSGGTVTNNFKLCTLQQNGTYDDDGDTNTAEVPAYTCGILIRIWVEGTDDECINNNRKGLFECGLGFDSYITLNSD